MTRVEIERFRKAVTQFGASYERALEQIEQQYADRLGVPRQDMRGRGREIALEAHARAYFLDHVFDALGWQVHSTDLMVIEDAVDPSDDADGHQRRLDYHGREHHTGHSLLIVESKRPSVQLPPTSDGNISGLLAKALTQIHRGSDIPVTILWTKILKSAKDYVKRVTAATGRIPEKFAISNGEWFAGFSDVNATLLATNPEAGAITIFRDLNDVARRVDEFYELLSYQALSGYIPPQHPAALVEFVADHEVALCARLVEVDYVRYGERQPLISLRVGIWIRTSQGVWIYFHKEYPDPFLILSDDNSKLSIALSEVKKRSDDLLTSLSAQRSIQFLTQTEVEGYPPPAQGPKRFGALQSPLVEIMDRNLFGSQRYRIITNDKANFLADDVSFDKCPYHDWGGCDVGDREGKGPISAPSCEPSCFFPSGSSFHCAHAEIHIARRNKCLLLPFEEYLCCRRCNFFTRCWPDSANMPCRQTPGA